MILNIAIIIAIILFIMIIYVIIVYNKFQQFIIRINEAEGQIDENLRKRFDLLNRSISIIKANVEIDEDFLEDIVKLRSRKLSSFDLDRRLTSSMNEFYNINEQYSSQLSQIDSFRNLCIDLAITEEQLTSTKIYFNNVITQYNKLIRIFPSNVIGKLFKYSEKTFFDTKNMYDEIYNDFKI